MEKAKPVFEYEGQLDEAIINQVSFLVSTPVGTVIYDRSFGMDMSFIDAPPHIAESLFASELSDKLEKYIPSVQLKKVTFHRKEMEGELLVRMVII